MATMNELRKMFYETGNKAFEYLAKKAAEYGKFSFDKDDSLVMIDMCPNCHFIVTELECGEEGELIVNGYEDYGAAHSDEIISYTICDDDIVTSTEVWLDIACYIERVENESDGCCNPLSFAGVSDWANHYAEDYKRRMELIKQRYNF